ncbi:hypothetical protein BDY24DRAFT_406961 [Mrakia frigida]|uniref:ATP-binding protein n=1 Tax=Mrakia frigida TaxID=29902 RepID=UPI003FCBF1DF
MGFSLTSSPALDAALATFVGLFLVFGSGIAYLAWYKFIVLHRMSKAFEAGYDPALDLSNASRRRQLHSVGTALSEEGEDVHLVRDEQAAVDRIIRGEEQGNYYLIIGSKGTGKSTMILDSMRAIQADGAAFIDAHPDLEVFRLRLGKALNFDFHEDWQGALFSRADPRNGGPSLDIERALNKLEKVALKYTRARGRPLVMIFNNVHLFPDTDEGQAILLQLQQRAESWAEAGIMTMVFSTDDFWPYELFRRTASRMKILSIYDLPHPIAIKALRRLHKDAHPHLPPPPSSVLEAVVDLIGGRTSYLNRCARSSDMMEEALFMVRSEREFLMSKLGLIPDCDDDVMDEQKECSCSWLLLRELAKNHESIVSEPLPDSPDQVPQLLESPANETDETGWVTYGQARSIMTRADFLMPLDHKNIVSIDVNHRVRPDSRLTLSAIRTIVSEEGFDELLDGVRARIDEIESLHRTSEWMLKEPFRVGRWKSKDGKSSGMQFVGMGPPGDDDEEEEKGGRRLSNFWKLFG